MQAIEYHGNRNLKYVTDRPIPEITHPHDVKIKISHCGICGSDLHEYLDGPIFFDGEINAVSKKKKLGQCLGHELCGVITEVGSDVSHHLQPGQHVVLEANGSCLDKSIYNSCKKNKMMFVVLVLMVDIMLVSDLDFMALGMIMVDLLNTLLPQKIK